MGEGWQGVGTAAYPSWTTHNPPSTRPTPRIVTRRGEHWRTEAGGATQTQCLTLCLIGLTLSQASSGATLERRGGYPPVSIVAVLRARPAEQAPTGGGGTPIALGMVPQVPWEQYPWYP